MLFMLNWLLVTVINRMPSALEPDMMLPLTVRLEPRMVTPSPALVVTVLLSMTMFEVDVLAMRMPSPPLLRTLLPLTCAPLTVPRICTVPILVPPDTLPSRMLLSTRLLLPRISMAAAVEPLSKLTMVRLLTSLLSDCRTKPVMSPTVVLPSMLTVLPWVEPSMMVALSVMVGKPAAGALMVIGPAVLMENWAELLAAMALAFRMNCCREPCPLEFGLLITL